MFALRITQRKYRMPRNVLLGVAAIAIVAVCLYGRGTSPAPITEDAADAESAPMPGTHDPSWLTSRAELPPPDPDRIEYDAKNSTLNLYHLPNRDNWMVQLPDEPIGRLVGPQHRLPEGVDTSRTLVYYARAGVKFSAPVTVAQIEAGRMAHTSLSIGH